MARSVLYMRPDGTPVYASSVVREEKAAARTKKARQKPIVKRRKAIARGVAPEVARRQNPLVPSRGSTPSRQAAPRESAKDAFLREFNEAAGIRPGRQQPSREVQTGGLPDRLQLLRNNSGDSWLGGLVQNAARGGLNVAVGLPGAAQLVGENFAAFNPVVGPLRFVPGLDAVDRYQNRVAKADKDAANAQYEWATYNFGPLARGDIRTFGQRVYDDPVGILSTFAAGAGAVARAGNVGSRITRMVAPRSQAAARASKRLSELPHRERAAIVTQENLRRREEGKAPLPFEPGHGNRHRPPRRVRSTVGANEPGVPVAGEIVREVPRKGYSYNPITRTVQRKLDKARDRARPGVEGRAHRAGDIGEDAGFIASMKAIGLSPVTAEGKAGRSLKRETLDLADQWDSRAEVDVNQKANGLARALHRLKKDKTAAGIPGKERISTEEMAVTLHFHDSASARGGKSAVQVRDEVVRSLEGGIRRRINTEARQLSRKNKNMTYPQAVAAVERAPWVAEARAQVETVKRVPEHLLRLEGDAPDVVRVRTAVTEGRRADAENQRQSVEAGVVRPETAEAVRSRTSSLWLGGSKWWQDAVRDVQRRYERKLSGLRKRRDAARAAGNKAEVARLNREISNTLKARRGRVNQIKQSAVRETDDLRKAREEFAEADAKLAATRGSVPNRQAMARAFSAGRITGRGERNLEMAPGIRGRRSTPAIPGKREMPDSRPSSERTKVDVFVDSGSSSSRDFGGWRKGEVIGDHVVVNLARPGTTSAWVVVKRDVESRDFYGGGTFGSRVPRDGEHRIIFNAEDGWRGVVSRHRTKREAMAAAGRLVVDRHDAPKTPRRVAETKIKGISPAQGRAYGQVLRGRAKQYQNRRDGNVREVEAARVARDAHKRRLDKMEREALGFTAPRRPELVGDSGVYIPDRLPAPLRKKGRQTGPRASRIGPDDPRRSRGYLKTSAGFDMHPALMMHQTMRASANYTGRISKAATRELISTIAYRVPGSDKFLTGDSKLLSKITDPSKVAWISQKKLDRVLKQLDDLPEGKWMDEVDVRDVFADRIPEGANKSDYIAVHADSKDVWTEAMTDGNKLLRYYDTGMTYWKGGLLALSPKWYLNNTFGLALQYGVMTGADLSAIFRGNSRAVREAVEKRAPWVAKDTLADETRGNVKVIRVIRKGFEINSKLEEFWRRAAYANRAKRILGNEGVRYSRLNSAEFAKALETMPDSAVRSIARDVDFFIGNYRKFNKFEQRVMRRVIPFYSWLRVISRLTFGMPFRSPTRLALMNVLANASAAGIDPNRYDLPWYERSAFVIGNKRIGVNAANPGATLAGLMTAAGAESPGRAAFKEMQGWLTPAATAPFSWSHGMNNFGNVISPSPGAAPFGRDKEFVNPVTGVADSQSAGIPASEALLSNLLPGQVGMARKGFSGGWTPRDDATTLAIVQDFMNRLGGGERDFSLYFNQNPDRPLVPYGFTPYLSMLTGANVRRLDQRKLAQKIREDQARIRRQNASLRRAREGAKRP